MKPGLVFFALAAAVLGAFGQISLKQGAQGREAVHDFVNLWILCGLLLYAASTGLWIYTLSEVSLTTLYPFTALTFALVNVLAVVLLGENLTLGGLVGTGLVLIGIILIVANPGRSS